MGAGSFGAAAPFVDNVNGTVSLAWAHSAPLNIDDAVFFSVQFEPESARDLNEPEQFTFKAGAATLFEDASRPPQPIAFLERLGSATVTVGTTPSVSDNREYSDEPAPMNTPPPDTCSTDTSANLAAVPSSTQDSDSDDGGSKVAEDSELTISPPQVGPNQEVIISALYCNDSPERVVGVVSLIVDGKVEQSRSVALPSGACDPVVFSVSRAEPGTYRIAVDDMTGEFTVLPVVPPPPPTPDGEGAPPQPRTGISIATILAIVGAMLLLIAVLVFFFLRA
jgi:hypothetical protein